MKRRTFSFLFTNCALMVALAHASHAATQPALVSPYVFTDEKAVVNLTGSALASQQLTYTIKTITRSGWGPPSYVRMSQAGDKLEIKPLTEGIHILTFQTEPPITLRFLAMIPPAKVDAKVWKQALPRVGAKLTSGKPFKILSMGDSVTNTGDYESMLVKLLSRATGNKNISFVDRSYPGRSIDASVREWVNDGPPNKPDLGLLMYGLNDQITNVPLASFLEQYQWIAERLHERGADCAFLQPTPDSGIPLSDADRKPDSNPPSYILRTVGFGAALRPLAKEMNVPLAENFAAVWGNGGASLEDAARRMWPIFPPGYSEQFGSMLETDGKGDTIHLNALGHLQIAKAVFNSLADIKTPSPWQWTAQTKWTSEGAVSTITARNSSKERRVGCFEIQPPTDALLKSQPVTYDLAPGQTTQISVTWQQAAKPADLIDYPANRYLGDGAPIIPVVDYTDQASHVYAPTAPFEIKAAFRHERQNGARNQISVTYDVAGKSAKIPVTIPEGSQVGRIPLVQKVERDNKLGYAIGELVYNRYGAARSGEVTVDGKLDEWQNAQWSPMGEPFQARSWQRQEDNRPNPHEFYPNIAFRAGAKGIYLAIRTTGDISKDSFTIFFDPREPKLLGTVGRYFWVGGSVKPDGRIDINKGETSKDAPDLKGAWQKDEDDATLEIFVPYVAMDVESWPASGDLGVSPIWVHTGADDKRTTLMWCENGHWWSPRWNGVVRRTEELNPKLPYMVRVNN